MATAIDSTPYLAAARCTFTCIPAGLIWYAVLAALIDVSNGDPVPTESNELLEEARCLQSCIPPGLLPYALLAAVSDISTGGGIGAQEVYSPVPAAPDDPTKPALAYPAGGGTLQQWDGATWV